MSRLKLGSYHIIAQWWRAMASTVPHDQVLQQVRDDGRATPSYFFMIAISAGIATIGLLANSPAVIIGAMLVSPLMGPIMLTGVGIAAIKPKYVAEGALALLAGIVLALMTSMAIVYLSPLTNGTPEILARTRPNLFDLAVAAFSGLAGGYAVIRGRHGAIIGVAIATALMPPLAVVGYGIAVANWTITKGSSLLFVVNMVAIALSSALVAAWYGFSRHNLRQALAWQSLLVFFVLIPLTIPLLSSLQTIASEAAVTNAVRAVMERTLSAKKVHIYQLNVHFPRHQPIGVDSIVVVNHPEPGLPSVVQKALEQQLRKPVHVSLEQVLAASANEVPTSALGTPIRAESTVTATVTAPAISWAAMIRQAFPLPIQMLDVSEKGKQIQIMPKLSDGMSLAALRQMQGALFHKFPGWTVTIIPPPQSLPTIDFAPNETAIGPRQQELLRSIIWALQAWHVSNVRVVGFASTTGIRQKNITLAMTRAQQVATLLQAAGIQADPEIEYPALHQHRLERKLGYAAFRIVKVRLPGEP
ncbi:DUF389 domain-containing protein [Acidithiobacillus sulfuriphilus]|uniref:DUF389 domain-containing protein n=2 Tax=Acidithiobacillus sulfuriphilus TaxID=1867749 RepID=A0A3M8R2Z1_9PROT|nr:DUF389 domain-containing protein [Acidithiobacillus sulfuriphilus]RNF62938.1 DUF389 domain-containing protein [Acidithiobacillus sulfuriphilus]